MMTHTPGEWTCEHGTSDQFHIHNEVGLCIASTCDRAQHPDSAAAKTYEEDEANAELMAAAPDLLAACRVMDLACRNLESHAHEGRTSISGEMEKAIADLRAAIAKAEGR